MAMDELKYKDGKFTVNGIDVNSISATSAITEAVEIAQTVSANTSQFSVIDNPEYIEVKLDSEGKIIESINNNGIYEHNTPNKFKEIILSDDVTITDSKSIGDTMIQNNRFLSDLEKALKRDGFNAGGTGDWSEYISNDGNKPLCIPEPRCAKLNIKSDFDLTQLNKFGRDGAQAGVNYDIPTEVEFWDMQGNYFKKWALMSGQGNSSMGFIKKNIAFDFFDSEAGGDAFAVKFGDWVAQDSFHLKAYYTDFFRGVGAIAYKIGDDIYKDRGVFADRTWKKAILGDYTKGSGSLTTPQNNDLSMQIENEPRCYPDGFPCIVYQNGVFWGIYSFQLKKHRANYHMEKDVSNNIHLDGTIYGPTLFSANGNTSQIGWIPGNDNGFEIRNPKGDYFVTTAGTQYNADAKTSQELAGLSALDEEIPIWSSANTYSALDRVIVGKRMYLSRVDNNTADPTQANYKKPSKVWNSATDNWVEITFTNEVKKNILLASTRMQEIKDAEASGAISGEMRTLIEKYYDPENLIDYLIHITVLGDGDSLKKNWQWTTWDGVKWFANPYDMDGCFGAFHVGIWVSESNVGNRPLYGNDSTLPTYWVHKYYKQEIKDRWNSLYSKKICATENVYHYLSDWVSRIGLDNFKAEYEKWPESPCNRDSNINIQYWKRSGSYVSEAWNNDKTYANGTYVSINYLSIKRVYKSLKNGNVNNNPLTDDGTNWLDVTYDETKTYKKDEIAYYGYQTEMSVQFKSLVDDNIGNVPITSFYSIYPRTLGHRDNMWRVYNWINNQIISINNRINK